MEQDMQMSCMCKTESDHFKREQLADTAQRQGCLNSQRLKHPKIFLGYILVSYDLRALQEYYVELD